MIIGLLHAGSGIGNQLFRFVGTKCLALDRGEEHGMIAPELFKGADFMKLDMGTPTGIEYRVEYPSGKVVIEGLKGHTVVDAEFQSEADFMHRIDEVREWLKVESMQLPENLCIIAHRGGEYTIFPDLYLSKEYWQDAISMMRAKYPNVEFEVQTDDIASAQLQFPDFPCIHDISHNWRSIRYAKHLIVGNSSFSILPSLINEDVKEIIAPKYHAGHNKGFWQEPMNCYKKYTYI